MIVLFQNPETIFRERCSFQRNVISDLLVRSREMTLDIFTISLLISILLCSLVAGLLFGFAVVVMPGIAKLSDREFLMSFKNMDGIIQNNQPVFMFIWLGSVVAIMATTILGFQNLVTSQNNLLWLASAFYLIGVQLTTARINIPLNNELQNMNLFTIEESELAIFRLKFDTLWNRWNIFRSFNAIISVSIMLYLLSQL